ncbi:hypothetical protein E2320_000420, partial [Naja naja]
CIYSTQTSCRLAARRSLPLLAPKIFWCSDAIEDAAMLLKGSRRTIVEWRASNGVISSEKDFTLHWKHG